MAKTKPVCAECGSDKIYCDAYGEWNPDTGTWELAAHYDDYMCIDCDDRAPGAGADASVNWIEVAS